MSSSYLLKIYYKYILLYRYQLDDDFLQNFTTKFIISITKQSHIYYLTRWTVNFKPNYYFKIVIFIWINIINLCGLTFV